jgi:hypothetical protein
VFAVLVVVLLAVLLPGLLDGGRDQPGIPAPIISPSAPSSSSSAGGPVQEDLAAPPPGVTWQSWLAFSLPYSPSAGPHTVDRQVATGFAHTPSGALIAAVHAVARLSLARDPGWDKVAATMAAPGVGRDRWVQARQGVRLTATPPPGSLAQIAGFQVVSYNADDAALQLVTRSSDSSLSVAAVHMKWLDGDWKIVLVPAGGTSGTRQPISTLNGFIAWGAVQ